MKIALKFYVCTVLHLTALIEITMISKILRTIIIGPPGSGKGTISTRIIKDFTIKHLSSGDILREHIQNKTDIGAKAKQYIESGSLVPDDVMVDLISSNLHNLEGSSWLLDGFPRTVSQAKALNSRHPVDTVIHMNVPFPVIIDRIKGRLVHQSSGRIYHNEFNPPKVPMKDDVTGEELMQREDDKEETVRARLESFEQQTKPVLQYYRDQGVLEEFKGNYSNEIWPKVHQFLTTKIQPLQYTKYG